MLPSVGKIALAILLNGTVADMAALEDGIEMSYSTDHILTALNVQSFSKIYLIGQDWRSDRLMEMSVNMTQAFAKISFVSTGNIETMQAKPRII